MSFHLDDLDAAMALVAKVADLYPRLKKQQSILLQILAKQIIVDPHGEIIEHELNSPFVYLRSRVQNLSAPGSGDGSSEYVRLGVHLITASGGVFMVYGVRGSIKPEYCFVPATGSKIAA